MDTGSQSRKLAQISSTGIINNVEEQKSSKADLPKGEANDRTQGSNLNSFALSAFKKKLFKRYVDHTEADTSFHPSYFLRSFLIHLVYYVCLGPFSFLLLIPVFGWKLTKNMRFLHGFIFAFNQNLIWIVNSLTLALYFLYQPAILVDLLILQIFATIVRICVISFRYGYTSPEMMELYFTTDLVANERGLAELVLIGWNDLTASGAMDEIKSAMWRLNTSRMDFTFIFRDNIPGILHQRLSDDEYYLKHPYNFEEDLKIANYYESKLNRELPKKEQSVQVLPQQETDLERSLKKVSTTNISYPGNLLLREFLLSSKVPSQLRFWPVLFGMIHCFMPLVMGFADGSIYTEDWSVILCYITHFFISLFLNALNMMIVLSAYVDYTRRLSMLKDLGNLLSPRKRQASFFPRMYPLCPRGILCWLQLRLLIMDCGKKYQKRVNMYNSLFLISYCLFFIFIILYYFNVLSISFSLTFLVISWVDVSLFLAVMFYIFYLGIQVNEQFAVDKDLLHEQKKIAQWLKILLQHKGKPSEKRFPWRNNDDLKELLEYIEEEEAEEYLDQVLAVLDLALEKLEIEREVRPLKILGIEPNYEILQAAGAFIIGIIFAIVNNEYNFI